MEPFRGEAALKKILEARPWWKSGELSEAGLVFALRECPSLPPFLSWLRAQYPKSKQVILSTLSSGAIHSASAALGLLKDFSKPLIIDLVDIYYEADFSPTLLFESQAQVNALVPYFEADLPCYSYLELKGSEVISCVEKEQISTHASAGTYIFRNTQQFLIALGFSIEKLKGNQKGFLCPALNGLISENSKVLATKVLEVDSLSSKFHAL